MATQTLKYFLFHVILHWAVAETQIIKKMQQLQEVHAQYSNIVSYINNIIWKVWYALLEKPVKQQCKSCLYQFENQGPYDLTKSGKTPILMEITALSMQ